MGEDGLMEPSEPPSYTDIAGRVLAMIDHTSLGDNETEADIARLCAEAVTPHGGVAYTDDTATSSSANASTTDLR